MPPAMHVCHGRPPDCGDHISDPIMPLLTCLPKNVAHGSNWVETFMCMCVFVYKNIIFVIDFYNIILLKMREVLTVEEWSFFSFKFKYIEILFMLTFLFKTGFPELVIWEL